jgi:excisionase family DNA binding protein
MHKNADTPQEWMDLKGLTGYAAVCERTLREWIHRAQDPLPASRVGTKILVKRSAFDRWLEDHPVTGLDSVDVEAVADEILEGLATS